MDLIEEKDCPSAVVLQAFAGVVEYVPDVFDAYARGVAPVEVPLGMARDQFRQRGLAGARRAVEKHRGQLVGLKHPPKQLAGPEEMLLAGELIECAWPHPRGQGLGGLELVRAFFLPEVGHGGIVVARLEG